MDRVEDLVRIIKGLLREVDSEDGLDIRLHVDSYDDWWVNTGLSDYDSVHGKFIAASTIYQDTDPDELAKQLFDDIEDVVAMAGCKY